MSSIIDFDEFDKKYTEAEYLLLVDRLRGEVSKPSLVSAIKIYLYGDKCIVISSNVTKKQYSSVSEWLSEHNTNLFIIMYEMPLDLMPLHLDGVHIKSAIASWRLTIGK
jgi:hypothetical protein